MQCVAHNQNTATSQCSVCGATVCDTCVQDFLIGGQIYCHKCYAEKSQEVATQKLDVCRKKMLKQFYLVLFGMLLGAGIGALLYFLFGAGKSNSGIFMFLWIYLTFAVGGFARIFPVANQMSRALGGTRVPPTLAAITVVVAIVAAPILTVVQIFATGLNAKELSDARKAWNNMPQKIYAYIKQSQHANPVIGLNNFLGSKSPHSLMDKIISIEKNLKIS